MVSRLFYISTTCFQLNSKYYHRNVKKKKQNMVLCSNQNVTIFASAFLPLKCYNHFFPSLEPIKTRVKA